MASARWKELSRYSACDIADALLKLKVPGAGFLADITPIPRTASLQHSFSKTVAPASTFLMVAKASGSFPKPTPLPPNTPPSNLTDSTPYSDYTEPDTIVLISQPPNQSCAVVGGIHALRMTDLGARAVIVNGRVRDLPALRGTGVPFWSHGTSVVGAGAETKFHAKNVPISIGQVQIEAGDIVMVDEEENGIVVVPQRSVDEVLDMLPGLVEADEKVLQDVEAGVSVKEAFAKHRS